MATPTPVLPAPPGQTSNFENPPSLVGAMNIAMAVAIPLTCFLFGIRTYVRLHIRRTWIVEDWLALVAWIGTVSFCGVGAGTMAHYGGRDGWDITATQAQEASYWFNVASIHYGITICIAKLAVLYLYRRVFSPHRWSPFDISIVFMIVLLILFYTAFNIVKIWECVLREKIFNPNIPGSCVDTPTLLNVSGIFNTVTDFIILLLPVKAVWKMNIKAKEKITVILAFTFGLRSTFWYPMAQLATDIRRSAPAFSLAGTIVRIQGSSNPDKTWVQPDIIMWG
ncbi:integral membrane protein [Seiridium cupressi]